MKNVKKDLINLLYFLIDIRDKHALKERYTGELEHQISFIRGLIDLDDEELKKIKRNPDILNTLSDITGIAYRYFNTT